MHKEYNKMSSKYRSFNVRDKIDASSCLLVSSRLLSRAVGLNLHLREIIVNWEYRVNVLIKPNHFTDDPLGNHLLRHTLHDTSPSPALNCCGLRRSLP